MNRSPFFYVGDKYKLMKQLEKHFPKKIGRLIEPFCGGGSVFLNTIADGYLANDLNEYMIKLHNFLLKYRGKREKFYQDFEKELKSYKFSASFIGICVPNDLKIKFPKTYYAVYNKDSYNKLKDDFNNDKSNMMKLYILLIYGFNHMLRFNSKGDFNLPVGNVDYNKNVKKALETYFNFIENNNIKFFNQDFENFIYSLKFEENDFVYLDPPYLISSCEYNKGWDLECEERLLRIIDYLNENKIKFALSNVLQHKGKNHPILNEWANKYNIINVQSNYICYYDNTLKNTKEVLIVNYENA